MERFSSKSAHGIARRAPALVAALVLGIGSAGAEPVLAGFVEAAQAIRVEENPVLLDGKIGDRAYPRSELRTQITARDAGDLGSFFLRLDLVSDARAAEHSLVDLREGYLKLYLARWLDIKLGRQVATWGTGDLVFANDLFAKDWEAFFTGLDDAYLKPPQDLLRATFYLGNLTAELAASPHFTADNLPAGERLSVYNPFLRMPVGAEAAPSVAAPPRDLTHGELFGRIAGYRGSLEWALYGYRGFWPTPQGSRITESGGVLFHPRLVSAGASLRAPVASFLLHAEGAAYLSTDDPDGDDPMIANSQVRGFVGAEKSLGNDLTVGAQLYAEAMLDFDAYAAAHQAAFAEEAPLDEVRSTLTGRITKFMVNQTLRLSLFGYLGFSDEDWHLRPLVSYKISDAVTGTVGANLLAGDRSDTMFGQFAENSNVYLRLRYSF